MLGPPHALVPARAPMLALARPSRLPPSLLSGSELRIHIFISVRTRVLQRVGSIVMNSEVSIKIIIKQRKDKERSNNHEFVGTK